MKKIFLTFSLVIMTVVFFSCTNKKQAEDTTDTNDTEMTNDEWITQIGRASCRERV